MKTKKKMNWTAVYIIMVVLLVVAVLTGTYALWQIVRNQEDESVVSTGCFNITYTDKNEINLLAAYPMNETEAASLIPYEFTITNTCTIYAEYQVNLEVLTLDDNDDRVAFDNIQVEFVSSISHMPTINNVLTNFESVTPTLSVADSAFKLSVDDIGLAPGSSTTYELKHWLNENTTIEEMSKTFKTKIVVIATPGVGE